MRPRLLVKPWWGGAQARVSAAMLHEVCSVPGASRPGEGGLGPPTRGRTQAARPRWTAGGRRARGGPQGPGALSRRLAHPPGDAAVSMTPNQCKRLSANCLRKGRGTESRRLCVSRAQRKAKNGNERTEERKKRRRVRGVGAWRLVVAWPRQGGHGDDAAGGGDGRRGALLTAVQSGCSRSLGFTFGAGS